MVDLVWYIRSLVDKFDLDLGCVVNMDETGCYFDTDITTTICEKGSKSINIIGIKNNSHCTVFLAVAIDGSKLKPLIVFKGKRDGPVAKSMAKQKDNRVYACCQEKAYCDSLVMEVWIKHCLAPFYEKKSTGLLMMDNFTAHNTASVKKLTASLGVMSVRLPPNMTSKLQILDVGINKPFKSYMKARYNLLICRKMDLMLDESRDNIITRETMIKWVADSWDEVKHSAITNTSRHIGFTTTG